MNIPNNHSRYLIQPDLSRRRHRRWVSFRTQLLGISHLHQPTIGRVIGMILIWGAFGAFINYALFSNHHRANSSIPNTTKTAALAASNFVSAPKLTTAKPAQLLPGGPTGQLLPPGTMAPDRTYPNSYIRGQCTWYVAGRRQVPSDWRNAREWYYHAVASRWSVGSTPAVAAIAWTSAGRYGHVALVEQISPDGRSVYISEMNYRGVGIKSTRWVASTAFKYIY